MLFRNPLAAPPPPIGRDDAPLRFHRRLDGYAPTPLRDCPHTAQALGVERVLAKDESLRFGLPSFKILGASWAAYRALVERLGSEWPSGMPLADWATRARPLRLCAATDGNHGRAVGRFASWCGLGARIYVPTEMTEARKDAIASEGADVVVVDGTYDDAVARLRDEDVARTVVVSDMSVRGVDGTAAWAIEGYSTIFAELPDDPADLVVVQVGVGALAAATVRAMQGRASLVGVEPESAACVAASLRAGRPVSIDVDHSTIVSGLVCGRPSDAAWPWVSTGLDCVVTITDDHAREAVRLLAADGVVAGETGAAGIAGLLAAPELSARGFVLTIVTEGATNPDSWTAIVGRPPPGR